MADIPLLVCTAGPLEGQSFRVSEDGLDIGRSTENGLVLLDDHGVSRFHARLLYDNGSLWLRDAGSRNGVYVNGKRLEDHKALNVGDEIRISAHTFKVCWDEGDVEGNDSPTDVRSAPPRPWWSRWPFGS